MTDEAKREFIGGEVVMHSSAVIRHLMASRHLFVLLHTHVARQRPGLVHVEMALCVFTGNDYEPELAFFGRSKAASITPDTLKFPVPDFIVEIISRRTEDRDRGVKPEDDAAHGVREYWIVDPAEECLEQYLLADNGEYKLKLKSDTGNVASVIIPGFTIPVGAIFDADANHRALATMLE